MRLRPLTIKSITWILLFASIALILLASFPFAMAASHANPSSSFKNATTNLYSARSLGSKNATTGDPGTSYAASARGSIRSSASRPSTPGISHNADGAANIQARSATQTQSTDSGPLSVTAILDTARAATATIPTDGGSLSVTAANGTVFTLTIPKDALLEPQNIKMTPIASISDLPFSGGLSSGGAVQLEPEALQLGTGAALAIQAPSPIALADQSPFSWYGSGPDFHLYPLTLDTTTTTLRVSRFGGYGIASGSSSDRISVAGHQPDHFEARRDQKIQAAFEDARQKLPFNPTKKQLKKAKKKLNKTLTNLFDQDLAAIEEELTPPAANQTLAPQVSSGSGLLCGLFDLLSWVIDQQEAELAAPLPASALDKAFNAVQVLRDQDFQACQEDVLAVGRLLLLATLTNLLATLQKGLAPMAVLIPGILDRANRCADLELVFDSTIDGVFPLGSETIVMHAEVVLFLDTGNNQFVGEGPLKHSIFAVTTKGGCSVDTSTVDSSLRVTIKLGNLVMQDCEANTTLNDYDVEIDVGLPLETITVFCPSLPPQTGTAPIWAGQFACSHAEDLTGASSYRITGWEPGSGSLLAKREYAGVPCDQNPFQEKTTLELRKQSQ